MLIRIISAIVAIGILIPVLFLSHTAVYPIALAILAVATVIEICGALKFLKKWYYLVPSIAYAVAMPTVMYFGFRDKLTAFAIAAGISLLYVLILFSVTVLTNGKEKYSGVSQLMIGVIYTTAAFTALAFLRKMENGVYIFGLAFLGPWITDTMAYFVGRLLGRHKLCPEISPKKTIEGSIGGTVFGSLSFLLYGFIIQLISDLTPNYLMLAICGLFVAFIAQIGDLTASLIKREHSVKDFGNIMPGHGGVFDRFDSVIAASLFLVLWCVLPQNFALFY